jgi:hypothetical protein
LRVLEDAGLLHHERVGRARVYRVDRDRLDLVSRWLAWFGDGPASTPTRRPPPRARR